MVGLSGDGGERASYRVGGWVGGCVRGQVGARVSVLAKGRLGARVGPGEGAWVSG